MQIRWLTLFVVFTLMAPISVQGIQPFVPETVSFCDEPVPLNISDVRERLITQLMIFAERNVQMTLWHMRKDRFFPVIERILMARGAPDDLKYVCVIESSLITRARSARNAFGPWQFLAATARETGLDVTDEIDERLHLEKATHAAVDYLEAMKVDFGSWTTALAGYNAGPERVKNEIYRQGTSSYYELVLPDETERYVFNALAVKLIFENPSVYGYDFSGLTAFSDIPCETIDITIDNFVPVKILAYSANMQFRDFNAVNPWINGVNLHRGRYSICVSPSGKARFLSRLDTYFRQLNGYIPFSSGMKKTVSAEHGSMRLGPGMEYPVFRTLRTNDEFRVSGRTGSKDRGHFWYIFKTSNGAAGWIWGGEVTP
ncbi:transglycosylase SLT domain-containing protein [bacterium]|nr:transglycosylase SLT domain-containing protein [candidate division CSSED10-310 bacterium]